MIILNKKPLLRKRHFNGKEAAFAIAQLSIGNRAVEIN
jgi:hypothetical protein